MPTTLTELSVGCFMKLWILSSPVHMGGAELTNHIKKCFEGVEGITSVSLINSSAFNFPEVSALDVSPDILLVLNALEYYMANRLSIPGRPWICAASFCYADLYTLYRGNVRLADTGINSILTNCAPYVEQASSVVPAKLCYSPVLPIAFTNKASTIGTFLPNVQDRDFSFLCWIYEKLKQRGMEDRFVIFKQRYPGDAADRMHQLPGNLNSIETFDVQLPDIYIPVPRITDYRAGVLPTELIQAWHSGCRPLVPFHPNIAPLKLRLYGSLTEIEHELDKLEAGRDLDPVGTPDKQFCPSVSDFVEEVMQARERWHRDRVTG
jgi:hypothetical protein